MEKRIYKSYNEYIEHQSEKALNMEYNEEAFAKKVELFRQRFIHFEKIKNIEKTLCLGARFGEEIVALNELGFDTFGIDLVSKSPHVLVGDFNNLPFKSESIDLVYSNAIDHAYNIELLSHNVNRVLKCNGCFVIDVFLANCRGPYEVYCIKSIEEVISEFSKYFEFVERIDTLVPLYEKQKDSQLILSKRFMV